MSRNSRRGARIRARAEARGERHSDALRRYAEEGGRAESHPGIVFRPGPSGRRVALACGPDISEICLAARRVGGGRQVAEQLAEDLSLTPIELHERETAHYDSLAGD